MQQWKVGAVTVTSVIEYEVPLPPGGFLPGATSELVASHPWLRPDFADEQGQLLLRIQALVVESEGLRIVVDTCVGNDKPRTRELFDRIQGPFLTNFADAGFSLASVDRVICTHLHVDHVGWNTVIGPDGEWVPTFPNARYLVGRVELAHWVTEPSPDGDLLGDSVELGAGETATLQLKFNRKVRKLVTRAFKNHKKSTVKVNATAADAAGNVSVDDRKVKVESEKKK